MRKWIDLVEQKLTEGVDFRPAVMTKEVRDGEEHTIIDYPPDTTRREWLTCKYCDGTGLDYTYEGPPHARVKKLLPGTHCEPCSPPWGDGKGKTHEWVYDFPQMRVTYMHIDLLCDVLGVPYDEHGWVPPEKLPELKRRLMQVINGNSTGLAKPTTDEGGHLRVDKSGEVPRITRSARVIGVGVSDDMVKAGARRFLEIVDWAQKHGCGVSWA